MLSFTVIGAVASVALMATESTGEFLIITPEEAPIPAHTSHGIDPHDSGDLLRHLPGISGSRLGAMGIDPIMRGQGEGGVGLQANDATILAGCPNRMDPPSSYLNPSLFDELIVERGLHSLAHGLPTPGGSLRLYRRARIRDGEEEAHLAGEISSQWRSIDDQRAISADVNAGRGPWALRTLLSAQEASDYRDGNNQQVSAANRSAQGSVLGAWQVASDWRLDAEASVSNHREVRYPGAGMDSPNSTARYATLGWTWSVDQEFLRRSRLALHWSEVEHVMDNFTLRENASGMLREAPSQTRSIGGRWSMHLGMDEVRTGGAWSLQVGLDGAHNRQDAELINRNTNAPISPMWNDIDTRQLGVYGEGVYGLSTALRVETSLRVDWWRMDRADHSLVDTAALDNAYNSAASSMEEFLPAAILGLQADVSHSWTLRLAGSLAHRPATATEGFFMRRPGPLPGMWHLGNPTLKPERHQMVDVSMHTAGEWFGVEGNTQAEIFYHRVDNAIRQVRAGPGEPLLYDNTDIEMIGIVWEGRLDYNLYPGHRLLLQADASYTRASNRNDTSGVARIAPASAGLSLDWEGPSYGLGLGSQGEYRQHRIDSLRDVGPSSSWVTLGLRGYWDLTPALRLRAGIDNLFDRAYAYHLSQENIFDDSDTERVSEPGRSWWLAGSWRF